VKSAGDEALFYTDFSILNDVLKQETETWY